MLDPSRAAKIASLEDGDGYLPADHGRRVILRAASSVARAALLVAESQSRTYEISTDGSTDHGSQPDGVGELAAGLGAHPHLESSPPVARGVNRRRPPAYTRSASVGTRFHCAASVARVTSGPDGT